MRQEKFSGLNRSAAQPEWRREKMCIKLLIPLFLLPLLEICVLIESCRLIEAWFTLAADRIDYIGDQFTEKNVFVAIQPLFGDWEDVLRVNRADFLLDIVSLLSCQVLFLR